MKFTADFEQWWSGEDMGFAFEDDDAQIVKRVAWEAWRRGRERLYVQMGRVTETRQEFAPLTYTY